MAGFLITYRPDIVGYDRSHVEAERVEGWREDYAFFQEGRSTPSYLVPRDLVLSVAQDSDAS